MIRESIKSNTFPEFIKNFMNVNYPDKNFPQWIKDALLAVNINFDSENKEVNINVNNS